MTSAGKAVGPSGRAVARAREVGPGLAIALTLAAAASFVSLTYGGPVMLLALLLGMALNFVSEAPRCRPGIEFASTRILRIGVALLGARIALEDVVGLGAGTIEIVVGGVAITIVAGILTARLVGRGSRFGTLIGGATAICGASAALAIASVLPKRPGSEQETIFTVIAVTTLSTAAMILYPALFQFLGFEEQAVGILIGVTIHDVAQVVGAGYAVSEPAGDAATIVKLLRVALLLPTVLLISAIFTRARTGDEERRLPVPLFVLAFATLVAVNSAGLIPGWLSEPMAAASRWCLIAAIAAVGLSTSLREIATVGLPPVLVACSATLVLLLFALAALLAYGPA